MASAGFYLMHRGWQDHPVFRAEAFSRRDAFVWLIEEAAWDERRVGTPGGSVTLSRGQLTHSVRFMATAWKWEPTKVHRFLKALSHEQMIVIETTTASATAQGVITICNYDRYQIGGEGRATAGATATQQPRNSNATNEKEGNKGNEGNSGANAPLRAQRGSRLPEGWRPKTLNRTTVAGEIAEARGQQWMRRTFEMFELHWRAETGRSAVKSDWQAAWSKWVIEQDRRDGRNGRGSNGHAPDPLLAAYNDVLAEVEAERRAAEGDHGARLALPPG